MAVVTSTTHTLAKMNRELRRRMLHKNNRPLKGDGKLYITKTATIPTTSMQANEQTEFFYFPEKFLLTRLVLISEDLGASDGVIDLQVRNAAGTKVVLVNDSTITVAGGTEELDVTIVLPLDVGGKVLDIEFVTAMTTPAEGDISIYAEGFIDAAFDGIVL